MYRVSLITAVDMVTGCSRAIGARVTNKQGTVSQNVAFNTEPISKADEQSAETIAHYKYHTDAFLFVRSLAGMHGQEDQTETVTDEPGLFVCLVSH